MKTLLVISSGQSSNSIAATVLSYLQEVFSEEETSNYEIKAIPLIGKGTQFEEAGYRVVTGWDTSFPGIGYLLNIFNLYKASQKKYFKVIKKQTKTVYKESRYASLILCVGNIFSIILALFWGRGKPVIYLPTKNSSLVKGFNFIEKWLIKKSVSSVICRDKLSASKLIADGINAKYFGNPVMDDHILKVKESSLNVNERRRKVVLLPGNNETVYQNVAQFLKIIKGLGKMNNTQIILSLGSQLNLKQLAGGINNNGWLLKEDTSFKNVIAVISNKQANNIYVVPGMFKAALLEAYCAFAVGGMGSEQATGLGIPLIILKANEGNNSYNYYKRLFGEAAFAPTGFNRFVAKRINQLLDDPKKLYVMGAAGKQRIGTEGGSYAIAREIYYHFARSS